MNPPLQGKAKAGSRSGGLVAGLALGSLALGVWSGAEARPVDPMDAGVPAVRLYTDEQGLPQMTVISLAFDREGYLWAGTYNGPARYNGRSWTAVKLPASLASVDVRCILPAEDGSVWFGTFNGGIARLQGDQWTVFDQRSGLPDNQVRALLERRDAAGHVQIWAATLGGIGRWDGRAWTSYGREQGLPSEEVWCLLDAPGPTDAPDLWAGTSKGLASYQDGRWRALADTPVGDAAIQCLLQTRREDGTPILWVGTEERGLARWAREGWTFETSRTGLPDDRVNALLATTGQDNSSVVWAGTRKGLARLRNGRWDVLDRRAGLASEYIRSLIGGPDSAQASMVWAGTDGGGVARITEDLWLRFTEASGLPEAQVTALAETRDGAGGSTWWVGTDGGGLFRFEAGRFQHVGIQGMQSADHVTSLLASSSARGQPVLWVGTDGGGVARLGEAGWSVYGPESGLPSGRVWALLETAEPDGSKSLWAGTYGGGLARLEAGRWQAWNKANSGLPDDGVWSLLHTLEPDGTPALWIGTAAGGVARWAKGAWTVHDTKSGLPNDSIWSMCDVIDAEGTRQLWVGTDGGLARFDYRTRAWSVLSSSTQPALPSNFVYGIVQTPDRRVHLFTGKGVASLTLRSKAASGAGLAVETFTIEDGLPSNECVASTGMLDSRGRLWAGTLKGPAVYDPGRPRRRMAPKPLRLERAAVHGRPDSLREGQTLPHTQNRLEFSLALLSFFREADTRYRTQLEGVDMAPSDWLPDSTLIYRGLPPGSYRFIAWGRDSEGLVAGPLTLGFEILPPLWKTWWALAGYVLASALLLRAGVRFRMRVLHARNATLEGLVSERTAQLARTIQSLRLSEHAAQEARAAAEAAAAAKTEFLSNMSHEIRTPLNAVLGMAQLLLKAGLPSEHQAWVGVIQSSSEALLGLLNDVLDLSKIESGKLELERAPVDVRACVEQALGVFRLAARDKGLRLGHRIADSVPDAVLADVTRLRQVLINLIGNAVKFTPSGEVHVSVEARPLEAELHELHFAVRDTGIGIPADRVEQLFQKFSQADSSTTRRYGGSGLGLAICRLLCERMSGRLWVDSQPGQGSTFHVVLPLPRAASVVAPAEASGSDADRVRPLRILLAEDNPVNQLVALKLLQTLGYGADVASNGAEAVRAVERGVYDVVLMDVQMPELDGMEAARRIRARGPDVPQPRILAMTASALEGDREACLAVGMDGFIGKPIRLELLRQALGSIQ